MFKLEIEPAETLHTRYGTAKIDDGYYKITTRKEGNNRKKLHRLIFEDFYRCIPEACHVHHKDGNKTNNCIMNLQLLTKKEHHSLHNKSKILSEEHKRKLSEAHKGKKLSEENKLKISTSKNTSGYYRVTKMKDSRCKQGFIWCYQYYENGKRKFISSVNIDKLKEKVRAKELVWREL